MLKRLKHAEAWLAATVMMWGADAMAAGGDLTSSAGTVKNGLNAVVELLPVGSLILGFLTAAGGVLMQIYKHHKSQGSEGNMTAGLVGILIGMCLLALGGFLKLTGTSIGVDATGYNPLVWVVL
jgi:uncharacterized membrane protein YeaQ/YmgE (transglycosylase-associated protein family)